MSWTRAEMARLLKLAENGELLGVDIAAKLGKSAQTTRYMMRRLGLDVAKRAKNSGRMGKWNAKHAHLRGKAMTYFVTHTFDETCKKFGLTKSELRSIQTVCYQKPAYAHLRKDKRRKDLWSFAETMTLLRAAGLQPRSWIARKLKRGTMQSVKEMISRLQANTRYMNGLPKRLAEELVGHEVEGFKVKAGPTAEGVDSRPIIVPWVILYSEAKRSKTVPTHILDALRAMSRFQKRIHGTRGIIDTTESIKRIIGGRL